MCEFEKANKKYAELDNRINEDYTLTEKRFNTLDKKRSSIQENIETLEYGIAVLSEELTRQNFIIERQKRQT